MLPGSSLTWVPVEIEAAIRAPLEAELRDERRASREATILAEDRAAERNQAQSELDLAEEQLAAVTAERDDARRLLRAMTEAGTVDGRTVLIEERDRWQPLNDEIERARAKFPGNDHLTAALTEEVGETAQAYLQGRYADARAEAIQVACVAWRIVEEGDAEFERPPAPATEEVQG